MGNCHSSPDTQPTRPAQRRSVAPAQATPTIPKSISPPRYAPSNQDAWAPPPYSAQNVADPVSTDSPYAFLREFDTIFLVDDSTSMAGSRWREAEDAIAAIAPICTQYDGDGIDIYFLNHKSPARGPAGGGYNHVCDARGVREIFQSVQPRGATPVGRRLHQILGPYMRDLERLAARGEEAASVKPLNIIVITDGVFTDDAESVVVQVARQLDLPGLQTVPWQVGIQFFQVGDDPAASLYLQTLDDELEKRTGNDGLRDIVDTVLARRPREVFGCRRDSQVCAWCRESKV
ncbi:hypothetical protein ARAM_003102 [Aspergillus rambellii]|uniref:VWFA domain-containing protein n=1 Tax=Aspergillus rambellii TaxID=308745 RepID=A0A0F8ULG6_9EURO|nr:hypothetical protein ARAM_003102 [Aspergillus rambellii]